MKGVDWRSFPELGIRGGVDGFTPTVTRDTAGRCRRNIPAISGTCLSPMGVHVYTDADVLWMPTRADDWPAYYEEQESG